MRRMNLEIIIQSEASHKEKKYHILRHIYGIYKDGTNELICKTAVETLTLRTNSRAQLGGGEGVGGRYGESNMEMCVTICKIDSQ